MVSGPRRAQHEIPRGLTLIEREMRRARGIGQVGHLHAKRGGKPDLHEASHAGTRSFWQRFERAQRCAGRRGQSSRMVASRAIWRSVGVARASPRAARERAPEPLG